MTDTANMAAFGPCHGMGGRGHRCNGPAAPFSVVYSSGSGAGGGAGAYCYCPAAVDEVRKMAASCGESVSITALPVPVLPSRGYIHGVMMARSEEIKHRWGVQ